MERATSHGEGSLMTRDVQCRLGTMTPESFRIFPAGAETRKSIGRYYLGGGSNQIPLLLPANPFNQAPYVLCIRYRDVEAMNAWRTEGFRRGRVSRRRQSMATEKNVEFPDEVLASTHFPRWDKIVGDEHVVDVRFLTLSSLLMLAERLFVAITELGHDILCTPDATLGQQHSEPVMTAGPFLHHRPRWGKFPEDLSSTDGLPTAC